MNNIDEKWKQITFLPLGYEVSNRGEVRLKYGDGTYEILHQTNDSSYKVVNIQGRQLKVHRLVASTFFENYEDKDIVVHKDGNKYNNSVENLSCSTRTDKMFEAMKSGKVKLNKFYCPETNQVYATILSASMITEIPYQLIKYSLDSGCKCFGHHFIYLTETELNEKKNAIYISPSFIKSNCGKYNSYKEFQNYLKENIKDYTYYL